MDWVLHVGGVHPPLRDASDRLFADSSQLAKLIALSSVSHPATDLENIFLMKLCSRFADRFVFKIVTWLYICLINYIFLCVCCADIFFFCPGTDEEGQDIAWGGFKLDNLGPGYSKHITEINNRILKCD